jgi:hypothetical protein
LTRLKIDCILYDGSAEFEKDATFKAFCDHYIAMEETAAYTDAFARAEGAVHIVKEHMRCLLCRANPLRHFLP